MYQPRIRKCWRCDKPLVVAKDKVCPKCTYFYRCECGACYCDHPQHKLEQLEKEYQAKRATLEKEYLKAREGLTVELSLVKNRRMA
jgi:hypothetical protein